MSTETAPDISAMSPVFTSMFSTHLIRTAMDLQLPDTIGSDPISATDLAERVDADPAALRRLLRVLTTLDVFQPVGDDHYAATELSTFLSSKMDGSSPGLSAFANTAWMRQLWDHLTPAVRTGSTPFPELFGKNFFNYLSEDDPQSAEQFNYAMTHGIGMTNDAVVEALDLAATSTLVDVGGGQGTLLRDLLNDNPQLHGVLFDIESALTDVDQKLRSGELVERCEIVSGDARTSVPTADAYVFRTILHNWDDESCVQMLHSCAKAAESGARVHIVEVLVPTDGQVPTFTAMMDLQMFMLFGSQERTEAEFAELFHRAGLTHVGSRPTTSPFSIIEARVD